MPLGKMVSAVDVGADRLVEMPILELTVTPLDFLVKISNKIGRQRLFSNRYKLLKT